MEQTTLFDVGPLPRAKLQGKQISLNEWACIQAGLDEFNAHAGARLGSLRGDGRLSDAGTRIGMRSRHYPALGPGDFREIVRRGFARPWWKDRPSVGVIFAPGCFEALLHEAPPPTEEDFDGYLAALAADEPIEGSAHEVA